MAHKPPPFFARIQLWLIDPMPKEQPNDITLYGGTSNVVFHV
jgi:hypothetical protein